MYRSEDMKEDYKKQCIKQRSQNLIRLREEVARKNLTEFAKAIGFTKKDMSTLESGEKNLSLFHLHAYKTYFKENHNLDISADFLFGYSTIMENVTIDLNRKTGLSGKSLAMLELMNGTNHYDLNHRNIEILDLILSNTYDNVQITETELYTRNLLFYVWEYIHAKDMFTLKDNQIEKDIIYTSKDKVTSLSKQLKLEDCIKYKAQKEIISSLEKLNKIG